MSIFNLSCLHNDGKECRYCHSVKAQDGWRFKGCFCPPLKGMFIAEVKECPDKAQKGEKTMGLIDKIKTEVEKKTHGEQGYSSGDAECGYRDCARDILSFLDKLEAKEDLETFDKRVTKMWGRCAANPNDTIACLHIDSFIEIARHFYELGLKAKGE